MKFCINFICIHINSDSVVWSMCLSFLIVLCISYMNIISAASTAKCGTGPSWDKHTSARNDNNVHCVFHNVCWHRNAILFNLTGSQSWGKWPIVVSGSSVPDHDGLLIDIIPVEKPTLDYISDSTNIQFTKSAILLRRFLPSNLFHVVHDDILPVFALKESLRTTNLTLFFTDAEIQRFDSFYSLLHLPIEYADPKQLRCFDRLFVGLPKTTLWYQYGFQIPQGSLFSTDQATVKRFRGTLKTIERSRRQPICTILVRRINRRILNLNEVQCLLESKYKCLINTVSLDLAIEELRSIISATDLLISMHGAELSLVIFLPPNAVVIELFPYAINSSNYTPYRRLCDLLDLTYISWENPYKAKSTSDSEKWLSSLSPQQKMKVLEETMIKPHLCCTDPAWLFRIYQDTTVDIESLEKALPITIVKQSAQNRCQKKLYNEFLEHLSLSKFQKQLDNTTNHEEWQNFWHFLMRHDFDRTPFYYPGPVRNIRCFRKTDEIMMLTWRAPLNYKDALRNESHHFEIIIQCGSEVFQVGTNETRYIITPPCKQSMIVWIQAKGGMKVSNPSTCTS